MFFLSSLVPTDIQLHGFSDALVFMLSFQNKVARGPTGRMCICSARNLTIGNEAYIATQILKQNFHR